MTERTLAPDAAFEVPAASSALTVEIDGIWALFARGVADKRSPFNAPTIATVSSDGSPALRTIVLRACAPSQRTLTFHTDLRSRKPGQISKLAHVAWHVWAPRQRLQVRVASIATVSSGDATAEAAWSKLHAGSRTLYRQANPPLTPLDASIDGRTTPELDDAAAFRNFAVVETTVGELEWLELDPAGHKRGLARWDAELCQWRTSWVAA